MLLLGTFIISFSLIMMNLLIAVLTDTYTTVIKTSERDWKREMLSLMQRKYDEVDKINDWYERPFKDMPNRKGVWGYIARTYCIMRAYAGALYYYFSLLAIDETIWMRGVVPTGRNPNDHQYPRSSVIYMKMAEKEEAQKLLEEALSDEQVCKHSYGEEGLYFPQNNMLLQKCVRRAKLDQGHSAWTQDDDLAADQ